MILLKILAGIIVLILFFVACFTVIFPIEFLIIRFCETDIGEKICEWVKKIVTVILTVFGLSILGICIYAVGNQVIEWLGWC